MQQQLQAATQDVTSTVKRLEKTFADERARLLAVGVMFDECAFLVCANGCSGCAAELLCCAMK